jgi:hypothetical protein
MTIAISPFRPNLYPASLHPVTAGHQENAPLKKNSENTPVNSGEEASKATDKTSLTETEKADKDQSGDEKENLSEEDSKKVEKLKQRDLEVKAHEQAHVAAGGSYVTRGAHYTFETGPDGRKYAVGGEVSIDTSEIPDDPQATAAKMRKVKQAALAPVEPSSTDLAVAAEASRREMEALAEALSQRMEEQTGNKNGDTNPRADAYKSATGEKPGSHFSAIA